VIRGFCGKCDHWKIRATWFCFRFCTIALSCGSASKSWTFGDLQQALHAASLGEGMNHLTNTFWVYCEPTSQLLRAPFKCTFQHFLMKCTSQLMKCTSQLMNVLIKRDSQHSRVKTKRIIQQYWCTNQIHLPNAWLCVCVYMCVCVCVCVCV